MVIKFPFAVKQVDQNAVKLVEGSEPMLAIVYGKTFDKLMNDELANKIWEGAVKTLIRETITISE